jgi:hypothetical protein
MWGIDRVFRGAVRRGSDTRPLPEAKYVWRKALMVLKPRGRNRAATESVRSIRRDGRDNVSRNGHRSTKHIKLVDEQAKDGVNETNH